MSDDLFIPLSFFAFLTLIIVLPIYWRHRQYAAQLDVVAKALEKGVDPATIQLRLPSQEQAGDPNGNWKAGLLLIGIGLFLFFCVMLPLRLSGEMAGHTDPGEIVGFYAGPGTFIIPGVVLLFIHYTIIGKVVRRGEQRPRIGAVQATELPL
jgi:hypothetical protein